MDSEAARRACADEQPMPRITGPLSDVPTACPTCQRAASLWLEFGSADCRREYYRCASCGYGCEVDRGPSGAKSLASVAPSRPVQTLPWWVTES